MAASAGAVHPAAAVTLEEALTQLAEQNPQIQAAQHSADSAEEAIGIARARYFPTVSLSTDGGREVFDGPVQRAVPPGNDDFSRGRSKMSLSLTQNVFDGFGRESANRQAELQRDIAKTNLANAQQSVLLDGATAYINVLRQYHLVDLARQNEGTIQQQLRLEDERVQRGSGIAVDVLQAKSRLQLAKERRVAFEGGQADAFARYRQVFAAAAEPASMREPQLPAAVLPQNLQAAVEAATRNNPSVTASQQQSRLANERIRGAESGYYPRVDLVLRRDYQRNVDGVQGIQRDYVALVQLTWELFSGFATTSGVSAAAADYKAAQSNAMQANRRAAEAVEQAWADLGTARERQSLLENAVNIAGEVFDARRKLRDSGRETALNVLDAQNELYTARINLVSATYDYDVAYYRLLAAMGQMAASGAAANTAPAKSMPAK
ncbi:MAG TPA: TolC family outer membrane protein [Candidatus Cybelea sp.]|nr:TolC family outer membrane protein [Candidatus Cybelea sp.]